MKELTEAQKLVEEIEADLAPSGSPGGDIDIADAPADQGDEAISLLREIRDQLVELNGGFDDGEGEEDDDDSDEDELPDLEGDDDDDVPVEDPDIPAAPLA